ncbi:MAG: ORF6N domain-containing protein, partial [Saprospiraceae bacterium]
TIRGLQVMFDSHLAELYNVETGRLNEQVKRNIERFPKAFMFQLTEEEFESLRSQFAILKHRSPGIRSQDVFLKSNRGSHRKYLPYVFTEQGVAMLSAVLRSETAVKVSIQIMEAFVQMRKFISDHDALFRRMDSVERKLLETDEKFVRIFDALQHSDTSPKQGIFYDGQVFDAYTFVANLIRKAKSSIILIDNYVDDTVLTLLTKRRKGVNVTIYTRSISKQLALDLKKHNEQYEAIQILAFPDAHDRFLIIDDTDVYHIGASLKDLGKKWFAFSRLDSMAQTIVDKLKLKKW